MSTRLVALEGVDNFRDYGDYSTATGARLRPGRLYRSGHHAAATEADLEAMSALNIAVVVDLRRAAERERMPSRRHAAFAGEVISGPVGVAEDDPFWALMRSAELSAEAVRGYLLDYYRAAPFEPRHVDLFSRYFRALARTDGAVLIHCAAGKDRTGMLAALTHHLVGVHRDDIVADYLLTNDFIAFDRRVPQAVQMLARETGREPPEAALRTAMSVESAYLEAALSTIADHHGSLDAYLEQALGVDAATKARIEERLIG